MVGFIFLVSIVNLGLGYVAAIALVEPPLWSGLSELWRRRKDKRAEELALLLDAASATGGSAAWHRPTVALPWSASRGLPEDLVTAGGL